MQHIRSIRHPRQMLFTAVLAVLALIHVNDRAIAKEPPKKPTSLAIITNWGGDSCSLVDIKGGKELAQIQVGLKPYDVKSIRRDDSLTSHVQARITSASSTFKQCLR